MCIRDRSYLKTTQWLKNGFRKAGLDLFFGNQSENISSSDCFATSTLADLIDKNKNKLIGSAQYWKKGHLLQHGEILLEPSKRLWKELFNSNPPKIKSELKEKGKIIKFLKESLIDTWPNLKLTNYKLTKKDKEIIKIIAANNFKTINHF